MDIKDIIKKRRLELGLTLDELAIKVGVSGATVSRWESGEIANMRRDRIAKLSEALDVPPSVIMGWDVSSDQVEDGVPGTVLSISDRRNERIVISINKNLDLLNTDGKKMVFDYSELLLKNQSFVSEPEHLEVKAAHERTDVKVTDEMRKHDDDVMDDDDF